MKKATAQELYSKLVKAYNLVGQTDAILFTRKDLSVHLNMKETVGNLTKWVRTWTKENEIAFLHNTHTQTAPDVYRDVKHKTKGLLALKSFDDNRGRGFDLANGESYPKPMLDTSYRLDAGYLILGYPMDGSEIATVHVWRKKIGKISGGSGRYPLKRQEKKRVIDYCAYRCFQPDMLLCRLPKMGAKKINKLASSFRKWGTFV